MITITDAAQRRIMEILAEENDPQLRVRAFVQGGGCQGFSYGFRLDDQQNEDDFEASGVLIDSMSWQYLMDAMIDYRESDQDASFVIINPNATSTCGCGSSFSPL